MLFVNLVLLCGDVLQNPGPVRTQCFNCDKTIRKNQRRQIARIAFSHIISSVWVQILKRARSVFSCSVKEMDSGGESGVESTDFNIATELR